jgi:hypothetical protein
MVRLTGTDVHQETEPRTKSRKRLTHTIPRACCEAQLVRTDPEGRGY